MTQMIRKTFGGLSPSYYIRNFLFGLMFPALLLIPAMQSADGPNLPLTLVALLLINTILYPYARFAYESVVNYIVGDNVFIVNAMMMLIVKFFTMLFCWTLALGIAPIGLLYLYFHHSRATA